MKDLRLLWAVAATLSFFAACLLSLQGKGEVAAWVWLLWISLVGNFALENHIMLLRAELAAFRDRVAQGEDR